ncbi:putative EMP1-like protein, partial [Plasmodium gaboni]
FADIGNIVKGDDLLEDLRTQNVKKIFQKIWKNENNQNNKYGLYYEVKDDEIKKKGQEWWNKNKTKVWHVMLCGYKKPGHSITKEDCNLPDDTTPQFLRWFTEWSQNFCTRREE